MGVDKHEPNKKAFDNLTKQAYNQQTLATQTKIIYIGKVVDILDPIGASRVKVYINDLDINLKEIDVPWANCLMPTNIQHLPKLHERVVIILENPWIKNSNRWWIGPMFSNDITNTEPYEDSAKKSNLKT